MPTTFQCAFLRAAARCGEPILQCSVYPRHRLGDNFVSILCSFHVGTVHFRVRSSRRGR